MDRHSDKKANGGPECCNACPSARIQWKIKSIDDWTATVVSRWVLIAYGNKLSQKPEEISRNA
jgi:hypothetical protein